MKNASKNKSVMTDNHELILIRTKPLPTAEECLQFGAHKMSHSMGS